MALESPGTQAGLDADAAFLRLAAVVRSHLGLDLEMYRSAQLMRRIGYFRDRHGLADDRQLADRLAADAPLRAAFADHLTINVTEFFRDRERFEVLRSRILPSLLARRPALRIWSAGCSTGAEVYSVAMLLADLAPGRGHRLHATDIDVRMLERVRRAQYSTHEVQSIPSDMRARHLEPSADGWRIRAPVRETVRVVRHNLLADPAPGCFDLILCRNVVIYFTADAKAGLYRRFSAALADEGHLFVGATEALFGYRDLGLEQVEPCFYRKPAGLRAPVAG